MGEAVIECVGLGKRYLLGEGRAAPTRLGEAIGSTFRRLRRGDGASRDEIWSLRDVDLEVAQGASLGLVGRNGAGKTTLLKIISRISSPTEGVCRTRGRVGSLLEVGTGFHPELTGRENVYLSGALHGMKRREIDRRFDEIVEFAGIPAFLDTPVKRYSSGMYLRLAFAVAAHLDADILLVDEVLAVGDAEFQRRCLGRMAEVERSGRTVLFVSHNLDAIDRLCERAVWLEKGRIAAEGPPAEVIDAYLGSGVVRAGAATFDVAVGAIAGVDSVSVLDASGEPAAQLSRESPITVEIGFFVREPVQRLDLTVYLESARNVRLLDEAWSDNHPDGVGQPGTYRARLTIPPILNVGDYSIGVWMGTAFAEHAWIDQALTFRVIGDTLGRVDRMLHLDVPWELERLQGGAP